ncbi:MAG: glycosyltransferase family 4 protein [Chloroflexi bacterium]|nr:glycosyltransferase family 4 protein [Chloroflexota bacterium]
MNNRTRAGDPLTVTVFMEVTSSLRTWEAMGILEREMKYYRTLQRHGLRLNLISYGGRSENDFRSQTRGIRVLCNWLGLPPRTYQRRVFQLHARHLLRSNIIRTHDTHAMLAALRAQWAWQIPLVHRMSYFWSDSMKINPSLPRSHIEEALAYERETFTKAARISVASKDQVKGVVERVPAAASKITINAHCVDCDAFRPTGTEKRYDLIYVGRLAWIKNLDAILEAVERTGATIAIIGGGTPNTVGDSIDSQYEAELKARFGTNGGRIHWLGVVANEELPIYINRARALILCSRYEGYGRSMLEALACGVPVIGSKVGGIESTLRHEETGYLCDTDADGITAAIEAVLSQPRLIEKMGAKARRFAVENFALQAVARREYDVLVDVARRNPIESALKRVARYIALPR